MADAGQPDQLVAGGRPLPVQEPLGDLDRNRVVGLAVDEHQPRENRMSGRVGRGPGRVVRVAHERRRRPAAEAEVVDEREVDIAGQGDDPGQRPGLRPGRRERDEVAAGGVADEDAPVGQRGVRHDRVDGRRDVGERARPAAPTHTGPSVLDHRDVVTGVGEGLGLGRRVGAVPLGLPEPAVDDHDGRAGGVARWDSHVVDLRGVDPVCGGAGGGRDVGHDGTLPWVRCLRGGHVG